MNPGKVFESDFKDSCKSQGIWIMRLNDTYVANKKSGINFAPTNICDFVIYRKPYLFLIENKSTKYKRIGIQRTPDAPEAMIRAHQISDLSNAGVVEGIIPVFLFNYRDEENLEENYTYALLIEDFNDFLVESNKESINRLDCVQHNAVIVPQKKKRTHFSYDIDKMLDGLVERKYWRD